VIVVSVFTGTLLGPLLATLLSAVFKFAAWLDVEPPGGPVGLRGAVGGAERLGVAVDAPVGS
jgi:hypothetical protein